MRSNIVSFTINTVCRTLCSNVLEHSVWLFCTSCAAVFTAYSFGFVDALLAKDITRLSCVILAVIFLTSTYVESLTAHKRSKGTVVLTSVQMDTTVCSRTRLLALWH